jgi:hypothetical protein
MESIGCARTTRLSLASRHSKPPPTLRWCNRRRRNINVDDYRRKIAQRALGAQISSEEIVDAESIVLRDWLCKHRVEDSAIVHLRELHEAIDRSVLGACASLDPEGAWDQIDTAPYLDDPRRCETARKVRGRGDRAARRP